MDDKEIAAVWTSSNNQHTADIATSWTNGPSIVRYVSSGQHQSIYRQVSFLTKDTVTIPSTTA